MLTIKQICALQEIQYALSREDQIAAMLQLSEALGYLMRQQSAKDIMGDEIRDRIVESLVAVNWIAALHLI